MAGPEVGNGPHEGPSVSVGPGPSRSQRPGSLRPMALVLAVALPPLCVLLYYGPQVRNWVLLEAWSEAGPRAAVDAVCQALSTSDRAALTAALGERPDLTLVMEADEIVAVKLGGGPAPPVGIWPLRAPGAQVRSIEYNVPGGSVTARVRGDTGPEIVFGLRKDTGRWRIERIMGPPAPQGTETGTGSPEAEESG